MLKKRILLLAGILFSSCLNLDSFMFEPEKTNAYLLDDYQGELQFQVPDTFFIPESRIIISSYSSDGNTIYFVLVHSENINQDTTIFYCHGNNKNIDYFWPRIKLLAKTGYNVFIFDYRGYGMSTGSPTEEGLYQDTRNGLRWLIRNGFPDNKFIYYGYSMGSAPACDAAADFDEAQALSLILESPIASAEMLVQDGSALTFPGSYLTELKMDNVEKIRRISIPLLWMHGEEDDFVAMDTHGETVFKNYSGEGGIAVRVLGATHSDVPLIIGFNEYVAGIRNFIRGKAFR